MNRIMARLDSLVRLMKARMPATDDERVSMWDAKETNDKVARLSNVRASLPYSGDSWAGPTWAATQVW